MEGVDRHGFLFNPAILAGGSRIFRDGFAAKGADRPSARQGRGDVCVTGGWMSVVPLEHRAGMVVAAGRIFLASVFLLAALIETHWPGSDPIRLVLVAYLPLACLFALAGWNRWWLENRLALPAHYLDLAVFAMLVLPNGGYDNPFFGFGAFLVIAAAIRWRTRQAVVTGLVVGLVFIASLWLGGVEHGAPQYLSDFLIQAASLFVLIGMILWVWLDRHRAASAAKQSRLLDAILSADPPGRECVRYAAERLGARHALLLWSEADEPWLNIIRCDDGEIAVERHGAGALSDPLDDLAVEAPFLFDCRGRRMLVAEGDSERMMAAVDPLPPDFAARYALDNGLAIPFQTSRHLAMLIAQRLPGLCSEMLPTALIVRDDIASAFERAALLGSMHAATRAAGRLSLARNLHDGAAQFLAGMALKLRAARASLDDPDAVRRCFEDLEGEITRQQTDVRAIIDHLRQPPGRLIRIDLGVHLETLAQRLRDRWKLAVAVDAGALAGKETVIAKSFCYELDQMIGEAASNAVRHGGAGKLRLGLRREGDAFRLEIEDDGSGFPFAGPRSDAELWQRRLGPLSLHQRVRSLGGSLAIVSSRTGSTLSLCLPLEEQPR
jgi:signal transduction histidine kinase